LIITLISRHFAISIADFDCSLRLFSDVFADIDYDYADIRLFSCFFALFSAFQLRRRYAIACFSLLRQDADYFIFHLLFHFSSD